VTFKNYNPILKRCYFLGHYSLPKGLRWTIWWTNFTRRVVPTLPVCSLRVRNSAGAPVILLDSKLCQLGIIDAGVIRKPGVAPIAILNAGENALIFKSMQRFQTIQLTKQAIFGPIDASNQNYLVWK
jgi:hypothetical protein